MENESKNDIESLLDLNPDNVFDDEHVIENEIDEKELKDTKSKSWFLVIGNPQLHFLNEKNESKTPQEICEEVVNEWCGNDENKSAACVYSISAKGFIHLHVCCCDKQAQRFSAVKKIFPRANIRATKGTKAQVEDYIHKRGKFEEKGEITVTSYQKGELIGRQGQRTDIKNIRDLVENGYTPQQIFKSNIVYRRYEKMVRDEYFEHKMQQTPVMRDVKVYWHVGESGCGKSYTAVKLCEEYGRDNVYIVNNYGTGMFDKYFGQSILFMDEFKCDIKFQELLSLLDVYTNQVHCRYSNSYMLWNEVHITSVFPPEECYKMMVGQSEHDSYQQLKRRISFVVYHYKEGNEFKSFEEKIEDYTTYEGLKIKYRSEAQRKESLANFESFEQMELPLCFDNRYAKSV